MPKSNDPSDCEYGGHMYWVYIIKSLTSGNVYVGFTSDLSRRLAEHNSGRGRYTSCKGPWKLLWSEEYQLKHDALRKEEFLKTGNGRAALKNLIKKKTGNTLTYASD